VSLLISFDLIVAVRHSALEEKESWNLFLLSVLKMSHQI